MRPDGDRTLRGRGRRGRVGAGSGAQLRRLGTAVPNRSPLQDKIELQRPDTFRRRSQRLEPVRRRFRSCRSVSATTIWTRLGEDWIRGGIHPVAYRSPLGPPQRRPGDAGSESSSRCMKARAARRQPSAAPRSGLDRRQRPMNFRCDLDPEPRRAPRLKRGRARSPCAVRP